MMFCLFIISLVSGFRFIGEWLILDGQKYFFFGGLPHHFAFYLAMFTITASNLGLILRKKWDAYFGIAGMGILLGLLPLFIDALGVDTATQNYHYVKEFHPFLYEKSLPIGESIAMWIWLLSIPAYIFIVSSNGAKSLQGIALTYVTIHFTGWISRLIKIEVMSILDLKLPGDHYWTMWWLLVAFLVTVINSWDQFKSVFIRIHHTFIWGVLVLLGAKLVGFVDNNSIYRAFIMAFSFLLVMAVNDYFDKGTDRINRRESRISMDMVFFIIFTHIVLVLTVGELDLVLGVIAFLCFILGISYSCPLFLRLKQNFIPGALVEGIGAFLCLLAGGTQFGPPLTKLFLPVALVFSMGFMVASVMKDYKDFKGDFACNIMTLYVFLVKRGWSLKGSTVR